MKTCFLFTTNNSRNEKKCHKSGEYTFQNMPQDQRRINGPETSISYRFHSKINLKTYEELLRDVFVHPKPQHRNDGRKLDEPRKICKYNLTFLISIINPVIIIVLKAGVVSQAKGSAYIEVGATKVIVSVFDPREIPKQNKYS